MKMFNHTRTTITRDYSKVTLVLRCSLFSFCQSFLLPPTTFPLGDNIITCDWPSVFNEFFNDSFILDYLYNKREF